METMTSAQLAQLLYVAYYGRPADASGQQFWADQIDAVGIEGVAADFGASAEFEARLGDLTNEELVQNLYQQLFGRDGEQAGVDYWVNLLENGTPLAQIALEIANGAQNDDVTAINNKVAVAQKFTDLAGDEYSGDEAANTARDFLLTVDAAADVDAVDVQAAVNSLTPGQTFSLTAGADDLTGTENEDTFDAGLGQESFVVGNTLSSADSIDGGAGNDTLDAVLSTEVNPAGEALNVQPTTRDVENINIEARSSNGDVVLDAKDMVGVNTFGSDYSDGDLVIQNVNTLDNDGNLRNTSDITVRMDHTDNFNSDGDASDLTVYFDDDYLLSGEETKDSLQLRIVNNFELAENSDPLADFDSVDFTVAGQTVSVDISGAETYQDVADAINGELAAQGFDGVTASVADARTSIFSDDLGGYEQGELAGEYLPIDIVSTDGDLESGTIERASDVADFDGLNTWVEGGTETTEDPISVNVELEKVGRAGQGGNLQIGGKSQAVVDGQANGIEVFNIDVLGDDSKPSSLGSITSTNDTLETINIATGAEFAGGESVADLTIRGFDEDGTALDSEEGYNPFGENVSTVDASNFEGDLTIGTENGTVVDAAGDDVDTTGSYAQNLGTLNATGGGDVTFNGSYNDGASGVITTGAGNDVINLTSDNEGSATVNTGGGNDEINGGAVAVTVDGGAGNDAIYVDNTGDKGQATVATDDLTQSVAGEADNYGLLFGRTVTVTVNGDQGINSEVAEAFANGFEGQAVVEANNVEGAERLTNQADLNDAVVSAVENSEVLSDLVDVTVVDGALQFTSKIDGNSINVMIDVGASDWNDNDVETLQSEYQAAFSDSSLDLSGGVTAVSQVAQDLAGGSDATTAQSNSVSLSGGEDTVVLSSAAGSVDTIVVDEAFGTSSIVNFTQSEDQLDLSAYLDSMASASGSEESQTLIDTTVETDDVLSANEVNVQELATGGDVSFNDLSASNFLSVFDSLTTVTDQSDNDLVDGNGSAIVMVENGGNAGEYKMFGVSFDGSNSDGSLSASDVELIGTADFGATVDFAGSIA